ncbi:MAG: prolipoprotein diacylglyceryl transferase [Pseudomonadota bacterium]
MLVYPEISRVAFSLGPVKVHWYGLTYLVGFVLSYIVGRHRAKREDTPVTPAQVEDLIFFGALGVIVGGRVGYLLFYGWAQVAQDWHYIYRFWEGGMSFHGGLLGVLVAMWWFARRNGKTFFQITDFVAVFTPLGLLCGRIGNFINGELWGKPTEALWGFLVGDEVLHPSMLYEAALEGVVLFLILYTYTARPRAVGATSGLFLFFYGLFRSLVEFVRVPDEQYGYLAFDWLTMGQVLSAPMILFGLFLFLRATRQPAPSAGITR